MAADNAPDTRRPDNVDTYLGTRVRLRRKMLGLSQEELGNRVGVAFQQIQKYEGGSNRMCAGRLIRIATALGVSGAYFFPEPGAAAREALIMDDFLSSNEGMVIAKAFQRISSPKVRRDVARLVQSFAGAA